MTCFSSVFCRSVGPGGRGLLQVRLARRRKRRRRGPVVAVFLFLSVVGVDVGVAGRASEVLGVCRRRRRRRRRRPFPHVSFSFLFFFGGFGCFLARGREGERPAELLLSVFFISEKRERKTFFFLCLTFSSLSITLTHLLLLLPSSLESSCLEGLFGGRAVPRALRDGRGAVLGRHFWWVSFSFFFGFFFVL